jgi:hypothetical protein
MNFEVWAESATDFNELKKNLQERGFSDLPMGFTPLLNLPAYSKAPIADTRSCATKKTMLQKVK